MYHHRVGAIFLVATLITVSVINTVVYSDMSRLDEDSFFAYDYIFSASILGWSGVGIVMALLFYYMTSDLKTTSKDRERLVIAIALVSLLTHGGFSSVGYKKIRSSAVPHDKQEKQLLGSFILAFSAAGAFIIAALLFKYYEKKNKAVKKKIQKEITEGSYYY